MIDIAVVSLVFIFISVFNYDGDYKYPRTFLVNCLACIFIGYYFFSIGLPLIGLMMTYGLIQNCYLATWPMIEHIACSYKKKNFIFLQQVSANFIEFICVLIVFVMTDDKFVKAFFDSMPIFCFVAMVLSFKNIKIKSKRKQGHITTLRGISGNISVSTTLSSILAIASLASTLPYHLNYVGFIFGTIAALRGGGAIGIAGIYFGGLTYLAYYFPIPMLIFFALCILMFLIFKKEIGRSSILKWFPYYEVFGISFKLSGRDRIYHQGIKEYRKHGSFLFGTGNGTFTYMFPALEIARRKRGESSIYGKDSHQNLIWLHNDLLQWFLETGAIGLVLLIFSIMEVVYIGYSSPFAMSFLVCSLLNLFGNFPSKMAPDSLVMILFLKYIII